MHRKLKKKRWINQNCRNIFFVRPAKSMRVCWAYVYLQSDLVRLWFFTTSLKNVSQNVEPTFAIYMEIWKFSFWYAKLDLQEFVYGLNKTNLWKPSQAFCNKLIVNPGKVWLKQEFQQRGKVARIKMVRKCCLWFHLTH